jgi:hypothetical protein
MGGAALRQPVVVALFVGFDDTLIVSPLINWQCRSPADRR